MTNGRCKQQQSPIVLITGAAGNIGSALTKALGKYYKIVGLDLEGKIAPFDLIGVDLTSEDSVLSAMRKFRNQYGGKIASVIHLAAYFDFTGEENPLYEKVNVEGTRNLLRALQPFDVEQFIYSGTMLVHRPGEPGTPISEQTAIEPKWAYPESKARAEEIIAKEHGEISYILLHLAGLYDNQTAVPTLADQIKRIYERDPHSRAYPGSMETGQSYLHKDDMIDAFVRTVRKRRKIPKNSTILVGEPDAISYGELQNELARLIHGEDEWKTLPVPKSVATAAAWLEEKSEPIVPDDLDQGEKPFIRPFMIELTDDHYELDISRAESLLGWQPRHTLRETLPKIIESLKSDPAKWYKDNGLKPPYWLGAVDENQSDPDALRETAERNFRKMHRQFLWAPFLNIALGFWLLTSPFLLGYENRGMVWSDLLAGALVITLSTLTLSWRFGLLRWVVAAVGVWIMTAPLIFWAPLGATYLNGTLIGGLVFGFSVLVRPPPGVEPIASILGPTVPPGWSYSPSSWSQRIPIIALAVVGLLVSRYLAGYQLEHIGGVWDPFFGGSTNDPQNGTEEIITSSVSEAWPVPDAGLGALTYMLEILTGLIGSASRWRTMPWLVTLFGIMIVPLGIVSITFIVIQPIVLGTWCTLCLIAAAAMVIQIPYSVDELIATGQFLKRRHREGRPLLRVFISGDVDEGKDEETQNEFDQSHGAFLRDVVGGGVSAPWTLGVSALIGIWLMFTRLTLGTGDEMANSDHLIGALIVVTSVTAFAESVRPIRFLNIGFGTALAITPFVFDTNLIQVAASLLCGFALIGLSIPRGRIKNEYGNWKII